MKSFVIQYRIGNRSLQNIDQFNHNIVLAYRRNTTASLLKLLDHASVQYIKALQPTHLSGYLRLLEN